MKNHITTKVSVNCIIEKDGKILLVQEGVGKIQGLWSIPGGKVDEGEGFLEAVTREIKEETNLDIFDIKKINSTRKTSSYRKTYIYSRSRRYSETSSK